MKCHKCKENKPESLFYRDRSTTRGRDYYCKECRKPLRHAKDTRRWEYDLIFRHRKLAMGEVRRALKRRSGSKLGDSFFKKLGYTVEELKSHLESQFVKGMSWKNYTKCADKRRRVWQIDHIIPQSHLPYSGFDHPNFRMVWALSNLRPIWARDNLKKGNRLG